MKSNDVNWRDAGCRIMHSGHAGRDLYMAAIIVPSNDLVSWKYFADFTQVPS